MSDLKKNINFLFIIIPVIIIPLLFSFDNIDPALNIKFLSLSLFLTVLLVYIFSRNKEIYISKILLYYLVIVFSISLVSLFSCSYSVNFSYGIFSTFKLALFVVFVLLFFLLTVNEKIPFSFISKCFILLINISFVIAFFQFWNLLSKGEISHAKLYQVNATFANKNIYSEVLLLSIPFVFQSLLRGTKTWRILSVISILFSIFIITILMTRTVWMAAIISLFMTLTVKIILGIKTSGFLIKFSKINRKYFIFSIAVFLVIVSSVMIYNSKDKTDAFNKQVKDIYNFKYGSTKDRLELWKRTVKIFEENPIAGCGAGGWMIEILKYGNKDLKSADNITFYLQPHNDYLWVLAEQGIIGFAMLIAAIVFVFFVFIKKLLQIKEVQDREILFLLFYSWSCYLVFSFFSFPSERIEHIIFHSVIIGSLFSVSAKQLKQISFRETVKKIMFFVILILCIFSIYIGFNKYNSECHLQKAFVARSEQNNPILIKEIKRAENSMYDIDPFSTPLTWYSGSAYFQMNNIQNAHQDFKRAYRVNPYHIHVLNNLGTTYELLENHDSSVYFYKKAIEFSPNFEDALLNMCVINFNNKNIFGAYNYLREIDTTSANPKYKNFLLVVLQSYIDSVNSTIHDKALHKILIEINNTDQWKLKLHVNSLRNQIPFQKQLMDDAASIVKSREKI